MSKKTTTETIKPIVCSVKDGFIQILFEGMKPLSFTRPKVSKEAEKDNPEVHAFDEMLQLVQDEDWTAVLESLRPNTDITDLVKDDFSVEGLTIEKGRVKYMGFVLKNSLSTKIISMVSDANRKKDQLSSLQELKTLVVLLGKIVQNSDNRVVNQLFDFIDGNDVMIDKKGKMQTLYVVVDKDGKSGKHDLSKGDWEMPRNMVDSSNALVVSTSVSRSKPKEGSRVMRVVVNPADVVSVAGDGLVVCKLSTKESVVDDNWDD